MILLYMYILYRLARLPNKFYADLDLLSRFESLASKCCAETWWRHWSLRSNCHHERCKWFDRYSQKTIAIAVHCAPLTLSLRICLPKLTIYEPENPEKIIQNSKIRYGNRICRQKTHTDGMLLPDPTISKYDLLIILALYAIIQLFSL